MHLFFVIIINNIINIIIIIVTVRKEFTKPAQQITEQNVRQLSIVYPEVQSPSSSTSLITGPVKMAFSPNDHSIAKNISTNHSNNNRFNVSYQLKRKND